jgi:protein-disulfide isomerase
MSKGTVLILIIVVGVGAYVLGGFAKKGGQDSGSSTTAEVKVDKPDKAEAAKAAAPADGIERYRVPLDGPARGPATAKINIVAFSDFQCPFCSRVTPTLDRIMKDYNGQVRLYFRHNPLPFHADAPLASEAALAAGDQGKFWEMHDKLFANQQNIKRPDLEKYAQELGLDGGKFKSYLDGNKGQQRIKGDMALATQIGVQGTPNFFVNGRPIRGALPFEEFKKIIDEEIKTADKLLAQGTSPGQLYGKLMANARSAPAPTPAQPAGKGMAAAVDIYKVPVGDAPTKGGRQPKVTIVEFSDFQCPFCSRVNPTLAQVMKDYGNDVQIAFRHLPLPFHDNAMPAAEASEAAREQGKFWEMHDKLFASQANLSRADLEKYAQEIGLNMGKFKASLDSHKWKDRIKHDSEDAEKYGARGTPNFFINGRNLRGAQPLESFKTTIDEEIKKADGKLKSGVSRANLYAELTKNGLDKAAPPPAAPAAAGEPDASIVYRAEVGSAPVRGPKDAPVTIVMWSDFQCPFCSRVEPTLSKVMDEYKGKVRIAWKDLPLPFHQNAMPAAHAARAAGEQGKFWEMHDKLFANQANLDRPSLEKYASELGLNMGRFKAALDSEKYKKEIQADSEQGAKIGARGTPAFFVNGKFLSGAQPYESFKAKIDAELKTADGLVAKGTPKSKVYEAVMKGAKTELPQAAPSAPGAAAPAPAGPEEDKTIFQVRPGSSPTKGPKDAPLTVIVFSDFQCPFCQRVEPTLTQMEKEYDGKIRMVWKNYPLPFHQNAMPAAEAAMAADAQGKFWAMHDKLFANNTALDRANLEKYAQELGLNMSKFKADLDSGKYKSAIEAEAKEGSTLGVSGTPAVFINGRKISGAYPFDTFKKIADEELAKKTGKKRG